jgi:hypothetical protein
MNIRIKIRFWYSMQLVPRVYLGILVFQCKKHLWSIYKFRSIAISIFESPSLISHYKWRRLQQKWNQQMATYSSSEKAWKSAWIEHPNLEYCRHSHSALEDMSKRKISRTHCSPEKISKLVVQPEQKWPMPGDVEMALLFFQKFQQIIWNHLQLVSQGCGKNSQENLNINHDMIRNQELEFVFFSFKKYLEYIQISHYLSDSVSGRMYPSRACSIPERFLEVGYKAA